MENIVIDTGIKEIMVNGDPSRMIVFNPSDLIFVEKFYTLLAAFQEKLKEYTERAVALEKVTALDGNEMPINMGARITLLHESCDYVREQIDYVFGPGTSQKAFGDARTLNMFQQFFDGLTPYFAKERSAKISQYTNSESAKRNRRTVKGKKK